MKPVVLHPGMGPAILEHLRQFGPLPELCGTGEHEQTIIAGQAVASAVSELFGDGKCVAYNDVDVFHFAHKSWNNSKRAALGTLCATEAVLDMSYGQIATQGVYRVEATSRNGLINEVHCTPLSLMYKTAQTASRLFVESFDLNCVQVGVRMRDHQLVWSAAFEKFMATRELHVMKVKTPLHTAIRWFRKKEELEGLYGNDDNAMEVLAAMERRMRDTGGDKVSLSCEVRRAHEAALTFGSRYAEKAQAVMPLLGRYFEMDSDLSHAEKGWKVPLYSLRSLHSPDPRLMDLRIAPVLLPMYANAIHGHWKRHACNRIKDAFEDTRDNLDSLHIRLDGVQALKVFSCPAEVALLRKTLAAHPGIGALLQGLSAASQLALVKSMHTVSREDGEWVWGILENLWEGANAWVGRRPRFREVADDADSAEVVRSAIRVEVEKHNALLKQQSLVSKSALPAFGLDGFQVSELRTMEALAEEGTRMRHCVQGYFEVVARGRSRIVSMRKHRAQDSLTVEFRYDPESGWGIAQARGLCNRGVTEEELHTVRTIEALMNALYQWPRRHHARVLTWLAQRQDRLLGYCRLLNMMRQLARRCLALAQPGQVHTVH